MHDPLDFVKPRTVLVVDDTPENLLLMSDILRDHYKVKVASGGVRALEILQGDQLPDIVLLDVMMPGMDGHEVIRRMRDSPRLRDIPVIFVTALGSPVDEEFGFGLGAVDYIAKPISPPTVLARVRTHIALSERTAMLKDLSEKLSHYLPPQVYKSIFEGSQDAQIKTERKQLTIFFSDIQDFTDTTESMQPEDLTEVVNAYFSEMSDIALQYGATLDKFVGDGILIFFGDPDTRGPKEDAMQCVAMAVAMQRRMRALQASWRERGFHRPFRVRMGIHTGYCNVGNFGSSLRMQYTIMGAAVNLAARLQQASDPDGIMLSYETWALVRDEFAAEQRPAVKAKGIAREIACYALTGIHDGPDAARDFVVLEDPGMRVTLSLWRMSETERRKAADDLQKLVEMLRKERGQEKEGGRFG